MGFRFGLYGAGKLGTSIASAIFSTGEKFAGVCDTDPLAARRGGDLLCCPVVPAPALARQANVHLFAVPDDRITSLYQELKELINPADLLVHFSGALTSRVFSSPLRVSAHPAQAFTRPRLEENTFSQASFALEGTEQGVRIFSRVIERIGARLVTIKAEEKPLYHALCVMSSNLVVGLLAAARDTGKGLSMGEEEVEDTVLGLARDTLSNAGENRAIEAALSGPVLRGDVQTISKNLKSLERYPEQRKLYCILSRRLAEIAEKRGLSPQAAGKIRKLLA